jgi:predicted porin
MAYRLRLGTRLLVKPSLKHFCRAAVVKAAAFLWGFVLTGLLALGFGSQGQAGELVMYGIIDTGIANSTVSQQASDLQPGVNANNTAMTAGVLVGGSRWGLSGREKLNDHWRVGFVLERGINSTNGELDQGGLGFGRQATLSLEHIEGFKVDLGLQMNLASRYFLGMDPFHGGGSQLALGTSFGNANVIRYANMIQWQFSPTKPLKLGLSYSFDANIAATYLGSDGNLVQAPAANTAFGTNNQLRVFSAGLKYEDRGITVSAGYDQAFAPSSTPTGLSYRGPSAWLLGARYDAGFVAGSLIIGQSFNGAFDGQLPGAALPGSGLNTTTPGSQIRFQDGYQSASVFLGVTIPLPNNWTLAGSWQAMQPRGDLATSPNTATQQIVSAALLHAMSPRLTLYAYASVANNYAMVSSAKSQVYGTGLAYTF